MAKSTIHILCPSGHRRKTQIATNSTLLQVLEDVCQEEHLNSSEWGFIHQRHPCDLTIPWRMLNIPSNAVLEMFQLEDPRRSDDIHVQLQLPDNSRYSGWFEPTVTLQQMLDWYRIQPESMIAALDISMTGSRDLCPVCSYMREEVIGDYALSNTTLRDLGLTSGTAVIRYNVRSVSDNELQKINARIDEKIVRKNQPQATAKPTASASTTSNSTSRSSTKTTIPPPVPVPMPVPVSRNEESSIFRDLPIGGSRSLQNTITSSNRQSRTLAEELGLNLSLDPEPNFQQQSQTQANLRHFKFPEATQGKHLYQTDSDEEERRTERVRPCDRRPIAYDISKVRSTRDSKAKKTDDTPDSFYDLTAEDLRSVLEGLRQQSSNEIPLETQAMRDRANGQSSIAYEQIAIRFVVNAQHILQGLFRPEEPVSRLIDFVQNYLRCPQIDDSDFYLYISPPRVILSELKKPLSTYDLAPAAYVHLGHKTISPLNVRLSSSVSIRTIDEANQLVTQHVFDRSKPVPLREYSTLTNERPSSAASLSSRPTERKPPTTNVDDKQLRDKLRKFLPPRK